MSWVLSKTRFELNSLVTSNPLRQIPVNGMYHRNLALLIFRLILPRASKRLVTKYLGIGRFGATDPPQAPLCDPCSPAPPQGPIFIRRADTVSRTFPGDVNPVFC